MTILFLIPFNLAKTKIFLNLGSRLFSNDFIHKIQPNCERVTIILNSFEFLENVPYKNERKPKGKGWQVEESFESKLLQRMWKSNSRWNFYQRQSDKLCSKLKASIQQRLEVLNIACAERVERTERNSVLSSTRLSRRMKTRLKDVDERNKIWLVMITFSKLINKKCWRTQIVWSFNLK